jgi:hypothetical protein
MVYSVEEGGLTIGSLSSVKVDIWLRRHCELACQLSETTCHKFQKGGKHLFDEAVYIEG